MMYINDSSRVWHVAKTGNDSNSGHAGQYPVNLANDAKLTIGAAISVAANGDTIIIWPGVYAENVNLGGKALTLTGTHRNQCLINPATGVGLIIGSGCKVENLSVEATELGTNACALGVAYQSQGVTIRNMRITGAYDGIYCPNCSDIFVENCHVIGLDDAINLQNTFGVIARNCVFETTGQYSTAVEAHCVFYAESAIFDNCIMKAARSDSSTAGLMCFLMNSTSALVVCNNCIFQTIAGSNSTGDLASIKIGNGKLVLKECVFQTSKAGAQNSEYGPFDIWNVSGSVIVNGCSYTTTSGTIIQSDSKWAGALATALYINGEANKLKIDSAGKVEAAGVAGVDTELLTKAVKLLTNKAVQDKLSGAIQYFDNDEETVILTHTPSEDGSSLTRAVS